MGIQCKTKKEKTIILVVVGLVVVIALGVWGLAKYEAQKQGSEKPTIVVSMYNSVSFPLWRAYVEEQCPDVYIKWENNRNTVSNVLYKAKHEDMPDIVAIRRFESDTTRTLAPYLLDLGDTDLAKTYDETYLKPFTVEGELYWLPAPGTFEGMVANLQLFKDYNIPLPTDFASFVTACQAFEAQGIHGFTMDAKEGWTTTMIMEGFGISPFLATSQGQAWREAYESGQTTIADEAGFAKIAEQLIILRDAGVLRGENMTYGKDQMMQDFMSGKTAMVKASTDVTVDTTNTLKIEALPFFGTTPEDSYVYTYPSFNLALSADLKGDKERLSAANAVLQAMLSEEAQRILNKGGEGLVSYNKGITLESTSVLENLRPYLNNGHNYMRVLSSQLFDASQDALNVLLTQNATAKTYVSTLNAGLNKRVEAQAVGTSTVAAGNCLNENLVSPGASVVAQSIQAHHGLDAVILDAGDVTAPLYKGDYTDVDVAAVVEDKGLYEGEITGAQLRTLLEDTMVAAVTFKPNVIEPLMVYPALAGIRAALSPETPVGTITTTGGEAVSDVGTYHLAICANVYDALVYMDRDLAQNFTTMKTTVTQSFMDQWKENKNLPKPTAYFTMGR